MKFKSLCVIGLCIVQAVLLAILSWQTSLNRTEVGHLGAAVYFYKTRQFDVFHVNPPLTRMIVGPPILLSAPEFEWKTYSPRPQDRSEWGIGQSFIHANSPPQVHLATFLARCLLIPFILLGSWFGYRFASELYGVFAGFLFLILWIFSPLVLGWGATICPDVVASSLGIVAFYFFWHWLKTPNWRQAAIAGICLGLLPLAKMTWVLAFPLWIFLWLLWRVSYRKSFETVPLPDWKHMAVILLVGLYVINMGYFFDGSFRPLGSYEFISNTFTGHQSEKGEDFQAVPGNRFADSWLRTVPVPLPGEFVQGIDTQKLDFERGIESYFRGTYSQHGWWYYFTYVVLLKEPLGILILGILAVSVTCFVKRYNVSWRDEMIILLPCLSLFIFVSSQTGFSLHPRYIIPAMPFAYIGISKLGQAFTFKRPVLAGTISVLLLWIIISSFWQFPHSMSYFNGLVGSPQNAPKHLLGSNLDWGQNSYFLKHWYENHPEAGPIKIAYFPTESLERLGIKTKTPSGTPEPGWYAIGVNELYGASGIYRSFQNLEPVDRIGNSIYIYHIDGEDHHE